MKKDSFKNLQLIVEIVMSLPESKASVERIFFLANDYWTDEKLQISIKGLVALLKVQCNFDVSCQEVCQLLESNNELCENINSNKKYKARNDAWIIS